MLLSIIHFTGVLAIQVFVIAVCIFVLAYISKNQLSKLYKYVTSALAVLATVLLVVSISFGMCGHGCHKGEKGSCAKESSCEKGKKSCHGKKYEHCSKKGSCEKGEKDCKKKSSCKKSSTCVKGEKCDKPCCSKDGVCTKDDTCKLENCEKECCTEEGKCTTGDKDCTKSEGCKKKRTCTKKETTSEDGEVEVTIEVTEEIISEEE